MTSSFQRPGRGMVPATSLWAACTKALGEAPTSDMLSSDMVSETSVKIQPHIGSGMNSG